MRRAGTRWTRRGPAPPGWSPGCSRPGEDDGVASALLDGELPGTAGGGGLLVGATLALVGPDAGGHLDVQVGCGAVGAGRGLLRGTLGAQRLVLDLVVQLEDRVGEHLRPRRAAGEVHVDRDDVVDALDDRVVVEH